MEPIKHYIPDETIRRTLISRKQSIIRIPMIQQPVHDETNNCWNFKTMTWADSLKPVYATPGYELDKFAPFHAEEIVYLPEPWRRAYLYIDQYIAGHMVSDNIYPGVQYETDHKTYYPDDPRPIDKTFYLSQEMITNKPHTKTAETMPVELARHFLRIINVRIERVQRIDFDDMCFDVLGLTPNEWNQAMTQSLSPSGLYARHWNDFIASDKMTKYLGENANAKYGWEQNPWVWAIEVERIDRKEAEHATKQERVEKQN